jgi:uncharacterized membrane protein YeaQ/YmgE (transglycosylase-associated protein family)
MFHGDATCTTARDSRICIYGLAANRGRGATAALALFAQIIRNHESCRLLVVLGSMTGLSRLVGAIGASTLQTWQQALDSMVTPELWMGSLMLALAGALVIVAHSAAHLLQRIVGMAFSATAGAVHVFGARHEADGGAQGRAAVDAVRLMTGRRPLWRGHTGIVIAGLAGPGDDAASICERLKSLLNRAGNQSAAGELEVVSGYQLPRAHVGFPSLVCAAMLGVFLLTTADPFAIRSIPLTAGFLAIIMSAALPAKPAGSLLQTVVAGPDLCIQRSAFSSKVYRVSRAAVLVLITNWDPLRAHVSVCNGANSLQFVPRDDKVLHLLATWCDTFTSDDLHSAVRDHAPAPGHAERRQVLCETSSRVPSRERSHS